MTSPKPCIVFVPGSGAPTETYEMFADHIRFYGFEVELVSLPSIGRRDGPPATMYDDADAIREAVKKYTESGKSVVLVCHSYGGAPATESLKGLAAGHRGPGKGGVERLVYVTAMTPLVGDSVLSTSASTDRAAWDFVGYSEDGYMYVTDFAKAGVVTFPSSSLDEQIEQAKRLAPHSIMSLSGAVTHAGYLDVPVTYLLATRDNVLSQSMQEEFIKGMIDAGAAVNVVKFDSYHSWQVSAPRSTARKVLQAVYPDLEE